MSCYIRKITLVGSLILRGFSDNVSNCNPSSPNCSNSFTVAEPKIDFDLFSTVGRLNIKRHMLERSLKSTLRSLDSHLAGFETNGDLEEKDSQRLVSSGESTQC